MIVVGLSSGTSVDAIDAAAAELELGADGVLRMRLLGHTEYPWPDALRRRILAALPPAPVGVAEVAELDTLIGQELGRAGLRAVDDLTGGAADLVASHGQTLYHWVEGGRARGTLQLGNAAWIAEHVRRPVVSDFRVADVAAGGHGAPLVSVLDALWLGADGDVPRAEGDVPRAEGDVPRAEGDVPRTAALNIGGIANVTLVGRTDDPVVAWDTGPGNCLIDLAVARLTDGREGFDRDGALAARGTVDAAALAALRDHPYFSAAPPKSTGRELFDGGYVAARLADVGQELLDTDGARGADLVATLTELTAVTVAEALAGHDVRRVVVSGGGARNPVLLERLAARLRELVAPDCELVTADALGLPGDAKEAYLFALLGYLSAHGLPGTAQGDGGRRATGAARPAVLGSLTPPAPPPCPPARGPVRRLAVVDDLTRPTRGPRR